MFQMEEVLQICTCKVFFGIYTDAMSGHIIVMSCYIVMIHDMGVLFYAMLCEMQCNVM